MVWNIQGQNGVGLGAVVKTVMNLRVSYIVEYFLTS